MKSSSPHGLLKPVFHRALSAYKKSIYPTGIPKNIIPLLIILLFFGKSSFSYAQSCITTDFSNAITTGSTPAANTWYVDRYKPGAFISQQTVGTRSNVLKHSILAADGQMLALADVQSGTNTQGRSLDLPSGSTSMEISLFISSDFASASNRRLAGFWGSAFNSGNTISAYPIIEFTTTGGSPHFRGYESGTGVWVDLGLPSGFVYNQWVTLKIKLVTGGEFDYKVLTAQGNLQHTTTSNSSEASTRIGNVILQGHNTPPPGVTYDIYWDDFGASSAGLVRNTNTGELFCTIQTAINDSETLNGHTITLSPGSYTENVVVNKSLTIQGSTDGNSILTGTTGVGLLVEADNVIIKKLTIQNFTEGIKFNSNLSNISILDVISKNNSSYGINLNSNLVTNLIITNTELSGSSVGFKIGSAGGIEGMTMTTSVIKDNVEGFSWASNTGASMVNNITVTNSTFNNNTKKGLYIEKLSNAVFDNITVVDCGTATNYNSNSGIDLNLKFHAFENITIKNSSISNSGATGTSAYPGGRPAISVSVRDDGTYAPNPATLNGFTFSGNTISVPNHMLSFESIAGPSNATISNNNLSSLIAGKYAIINTGASDLAISCNWHGNTNLTTIKATFAASGTGKNAINTYSTTPDFAGCLGPIKNTNLGIFYTSIQKAIDDPNTINGHVITIASGSYNEALNINKSLVFKGDNATVCGTATRPNAETVLIAPSNGSSLISLSGSSEASFEGFFIDGRTVANISGTGQKLSIKNSIFELDFATNDNNLYFNANTLTLECNYFRAISGINAGGNSSHIFFSGAALNASNNKFTSEAARSSMDGTTTNSLPVWFNITTNANNVNIHDNDFSKIDIGILLADNAGNVKIENNNFSSALRQNLPNGGSGMGAGIAIFQGLSPANPIVIRYNNFSDSETGIRTSGNGTVFPAANLLTISYNSFLTMVDKAISVGGSYSGSATKLNSVCNWYGAVTGPVVFSNVGADAQATKILDGNNKVNYKNWLIYGDANSSQIGFQLPTSVAVLPGSNISQAENHYRILSNAIGCATTGQTIALSGTFDYTNATAQTEWAKGNDGDLLSTADEYTIMAPVNLNDVKITGPATISGPGDLPNANLESFLSFDNGYNRDWDISGLTIKDFDLGIGFFSTANYPTNNSGLNIHDNTFYIPKDLNTNVSATDVSQNIGIHMANGANQKISNNTVYIDGNGLSAGTTVRSTSIFLQSLTTGGNGYDGLKITSNQIKVTGLPQPEPNQAVIRGIWENSHSTGSDIEISGNTFENVESGNTADLNRQFAFWVTSRSGAGKNVVYKFNEVKNFNEGIGWLGGLYTSNSAPVYEESASPVSILNNKFDGVKNSIVVRKAAGSTNTTSPAIIHENSFTNVVSGGFAITNESTGLTNASCNWYSNLLTVNVISPVGGGVTYLPKLSNGVDDSGATGFQLNPANTCVSPVLNENSNLTYITIQDAVNAANPADVIRVSEGIYPENVVVNKPLTIYGADSSLVFVDKSSSNRTMSGGVGFLLQADGIVLSKMKVQNFNNGVETEIATTGVIINEMNINKNFSNGFFGKRTVTDMIIRKSNLNSNGYNSDDVTRSGSYMRGIMFESQGGSINNLIIENNQTDGNGLVGIDISGLIPINGLKIQNNKSRGNFDSQIGVSLGNNLLTGDPVTVTGNTVNVSQTSRFGIEIKNPLGTGSASGSGSIVVSANTISLANHMGTARDLAAIAVMRRKDGHATINDQPQGVRVINNIISNFTNTGTGDAFGIVLGGTGHLVSGNTISNTQYSIQLQKGNTDFASNNSSPNAADSYFERDNSADVCVEIGANTITNSGNARLVTGPSNSTETLPLIRTENFSLGTKFCTIQQAIDFTATVNTNIIKATAGVYPENVLVNKSITLQGPNEAVDGNGTRGAEASITPGINDVSGGVLVKVLSNDVTVKGFSIDGSTEAFDENIVINGVRTHAAYGVLAFGTISGLTIKNNIIKNISKHGIDLDAGGAATSANMINNNMFDNIPRYNAAGFYGRGILLANNFYASVKNNTFTRVERGIQTNNFNIATPTGNWEIKDNNIKAYNIGAFINLHYQIATELLFENNIIDKDVTTRTISSGDILPDENFTGVEVFSINNTAKVILKGGKIKNAVAGIYSWNNATGSLVTVDGVSFDNNLTAVMQSNTSRYGDAGDTEIDVQNVTIVDGNAQTAFVAEDFASGSHALSSINLLTGNFLTAGTTFTKPFYLTGGSKARLKVGGTNVTLSATSLDAFTFNGIGTSADPNVVIKSGFVVNLSGNDKRVLNLPQGAILSIAGNFTAPNKVGMNPVVINGSVWFTGGVLNSGDGSIEFGPTGSDIMSGTHTETVSSYILGKAMMTSRTVNGDAVDMLGVKMLAGTSLGSLIITRTTKSTGSTTPAFPGDASIRTVWDITPSIASASRGDVQFRYLNNTENLNSQVSGAIYAYRYNLGTSLWEKKSALRNSNLEGDIYITQTFGVAEFSSWTLSSAEPGPDLIPILSMADNNFTNASLAKSLTLKLFNITPGNTSNPATPIIISLGKPSTYTIALSGAASANWTLTNFSGTIALLTSNNGTVVTNGTSLDIPLTMTAQTGTSNGLSNFNISIEDGSGGEVNNSNNSETRKLLRQP